MRSFSYPKPLIHGLSVFLGGRKLGKADSTMGWTLLRLTGWLATTAIVAVLLWHITADVPLWSQSIAGLLLVAIGLVAGLRLGTHSATAYLQDVQRLNKVLVGQNKELEEANAILLKELGAAVESSTHSKRA